MKYEFGQSRSLPPRVDFDRKQVHGVRCVEIVRQGQEVGEADGFWTRTPGIRVNVITADCVPILLFRTDGRAVAALHAGWKGTVARIVEHFFQSLPPELAQPKDWKAILGPSIRHSCYEVSAELIEQFRSEFASMPAETIEPSPRHLDLIAVNRHQLELLGIVNIEVHPDCTYCTVDEFGQHRYCSYRRGDRQSRQFSWIELLSS